MSTEVQSSSSTTPQVLDEIVRRARSLYSLPAIAAEVIELTESPKVDVRALKDCIEVDPALTAKILRVVNSSLFGLSREVSDLNQAIALLGTKPLKLLVLGFCLPEELFCKVAREQLDWYWSTTLSRAVAAREISEQLWNRPGDDAFLAGLLQDIGVLVLLGELQEPYANFLSQIIDQHADLQQVEVESLGFSHTVLSAALLNHWKMPLLLVEAISTPRERKSFKQKKTPVVELAQILHLAGLVSQLVAQRRLGVLPELLETGEDYCGLDKKGLNELVASLQPKVEQLAEVLSLDMSETDDYHSILVEAHEQMAILSEGVAEPLSRVPQHDSPDYEGVLESATRLQQTVHEFLHTATTVSEDQKDIATNSQSTTNVTPTEAPHEVPDTQQASMVMRWLDSKLTLAVGQCRSLRQPLSVIVFEVTAKAPPSPHESQLISQLLDAACRQIDQEDMTLEALAPCQRAMVLSDCERQEAVNYSQSIVATVESGLERLETTVDWMIDAGIATVTLPSKNFPPRDLLKTAERCLLAAQSTGTNGVKSLEIY